MRIVIGIPTKNESATVANVTSVIDAGLCQYFPDEDSWIVNADNASTDNTSLVFAQTSTTANKHAINTGSNGSGKGSNVLAILEFAKHIEADIVCFIDGDVRSVRPDWILTLVSGAANKEHPTFVTPQYVRNRYEANTTNQLVRPYLKAAFGLDISQPIGGEFAMNKSFIEKALTWPRYDSTKLYGIDVWLTVNAALSGCVMEHVPMGRKLHNPTFPKIFRLGEQVLDTLFRLMMEQRPARPSFAVDPADDMFIDEEAAPLPADAIEPILHRARTYISEHDLQLRRTFPILATTPWQNGLPLLTTDVWAHLLADAYILIEPSTFREIRNHIVGLFPARVATYWQEIDTMDHDQIEALLRHQNDAVVTHFCERALPVQATSTLMLPELQSHNWEDDILVA